MAVLMDCGSPSVHAQPAFIVLASTTSTEQSGLFKHLLPPFTRQTGIEVRIVAVGPGQALDIGRRGDTDGVFVHDRPAEDTFSAEGFANYDVFANPSRSAAEGIPCVVVIQSDLLDALATRLTVPLALADAAFKVPTALCPIIAVKGKRMPTLAHYAAPLPAKLWGRFSKAHRASAAQPAAPGAHLQSGQAPWAALHQPIAAV